MLKNLHFHTWSSWSEPADSGTFNVKQWRFCTICNKVSSRRIWLTSYSNAHSINKALDNVKSNNK